MATRQQGYVYRRGNNWFLRYRRDELEGGVLVRKQKAIVLAQYSDRYRRKSDLVPLAEEKLDEVSKADRCPGSAASFVDYVETVWLPYVKATRRPSTYAACRSYFIRYIRPRTQHLALRDFTLARVTKLLASAASMHSLNTATVSKIRSVLSAIFTFSIASGHYPARSVAENPARCALIPASASKPKATHAASVEDVKAILAILKTDGCDLEHAAIALAAFTGCRPGELRGLRWEDWDRAKNSLRVSRSIWHAVVGETKTEQSNRHVSVHPELHSILSDLWNSRGCLIGGFILARADGRPINLDNAAKRTIVPALSRCAVCGQAEAAKHEGHAFKRDETTPAWHGFYSLRRYAATQVREQSGSSDTASKALGNSKEVLDKHYLRNRDVLPDVRRAVNSMPSLVQ